MDTSERYIKMCEKAEEIQDIARNNDCMLEVGSFYYDKRDKSWTFSSVEFDNRKYNIWLPRQDQLQEILRENAIFSNRVLIAVIDKFRDFVFAENHLVFETMEQLWLAFVMKEKYGKVWAGEAWETIKAGVI